jgi:hypothetical protein
MATVMATVMVMVMAMVMAIQVIMEAIQAMAMKAILIDMQTANLQQDLEEIHCWSNLSKKI